MDGLLISGQEIENRYCNMMFQVCLGAYYQVPRPVFEEVTVKVSLSTRVVCQDRSAPMGIFPNVRSLCKQLNSLTALDQSRSNCSFKPHSVRTLIRKNLPGRLVLLADSRYREIWESWDKIRELNAYWWIHELFVYMLYNMDSRYTGHVAHPHWQVTSLYI